MNGIFTNEASAAQNATLLADRLNGTYNGESISVKYLLNASHLGGLGDIFKSVYQGLLDKEDVSDYDLVEMLRSASEKVATEKLLLVAHSQGNFYANSFYDTVAGHAGGVPPESIGVYAVATPSGRVAGGGKWITSDTDAIITGLVGRFLSRPIMTPNTHIALQPGDDSFGHDFSDIYLKYRSTEIIADIEASLDRLKANDAQDPQKPCIAAPPLTLGHTIESATFALADPAASAGIGAVTDAIATVYHASAATTQMAAALYDLLNTTIAERVADRTAAIKKAGFGAASGLYGSSVTLNDLTDQPATTAPPAAPAKKAAAAPKPAIAPAPRPAPKVVTQKIAAADTAASRLVGTPRSSSSVSSDSPSLNSSSISGSAGVSGSSGSSSSSSGSSSLSSPSPSVSADTTPPAAPIITAPSSDGAVSTSTTLTFIGAAEANTIISNSATTATTAADAAGNWSLGLIGLNQGTSTIAFYAADTTGNISASSSRIVVIDTVAPSASLFVSACNQSLSSGNCLVATTTLAISWSSAASDLDSYLVSCTANGSACANFSLSPTAATSTTYTAPADNTDYVFRVTARDTHGNLGTPQTQTVSIATRPVVINEIAWAGTSAQRSEDEWIELYNPTASAISLAGWNLRSATDNTPYITLAGAIAAHGFFLLERTDDTTISDIAANQVYTGGLVNTGGQLILSSASTTIDATPSVSNGAWMGGNALYYMTMERADPLAAGTNATNWGTFASIGARGVNADGVAIKGTPASRNSMNYFPPNIAAGATVTLTLSNSPYVIGSGYTVPLTSTLVIEPGVVMKFDTGSSLTVHGALTAMGTSALPIVFTSFNDDDCGISGGCEDTNGTTTPPAMGDWASLVIASDAASSTLSHAIVRYGGSDNNAGSYGANLRISNNNTAISNSIVEYSKLYGIRMDNAGSGVSVVSSVIRANNRNVAGQATGIGVILFASSPTVSGNQFTGNGEGLVMYSSSAPAITNNSFTANTREAISVSDSYPVFSGNSASGNGTNGIVIQNTFARDYTLAGNLPYIMQAPNIVSAGATLTAPAGAVIKLDHTGRLTVNGALTAQGADASPVVFTSLQDDTYGGDTNGDGAAASPAAGDWKNISFTQNLATSTLSHAIVRYGGVIGSFDGAVKITGASVAFKNSIVERNAFVGISMTHSSSTVITDSFIRDHTDTTAQTYYGLFLQSGSVPIITTTRFTNNEQHIFADGASGYTDGGGNVFE